VVAERLAVVVHSRALAEGRPTLAGPRKDLRAHYGLDASSLAEKVLGMRA